MIQFSAYSHARFQYMRLTEGEHLLLLRRGKTIPCQFVKATRKGFNILDLTTNTHILKTHTYMRGMGGKEFTRQPIKGDFLIPEHVYSKLTRTEHRFPIVRGYLNPIMDTLEA